MSSAYVLDRNGKAAVAAGGIITIFIRRGFADTVGQVKEWHVVASIAAEFDGPTYTLAAFPETDEGRVDAEYARDTLLALLTTTEPAVWQWDVDGWAAIDAAAMLGEVDIPD